MPSRAKTQEAVNFDKISIYSVFWRKIALLSLRKEKKNLAYIKTY